MSILHVTNGDSARVLMERSGIPGTFIAWPDVLHEGPTPLVSGEEWRQVRARYLGSDVFGVPGEPQEEEVLQKFREADAVLESYASYDEVVFWFEHDLFDQLLLIRHLWWIGAKGANGAEGAKGATRLSLVCGDQFLGLLRPDEFPPLFEARRTITTEQINVGTRAWEAFCSADPSGLLPFASADQPDLPYLRGALRRHLEEFPAATNGLARSERQILQVLSEGLRTPEETFVEAARLEDHIFMGDTSFWSIVRRLVDSPRPLVAAKVQPRAGRLPSGTLALTPDGADVLAGRSDHVALNGIDRWLGGVRLQGGSRTASTPASDRLWRWTGSTLQPSPSPPPPAS
jgi:hypothetical protein